MDNFWQRFRSYIRKLRNTILQSFPSHLLCFQETVGIHLSENVRKIVDLCILKGNLWENLFDKLHIYNGIYNVQINAFDARPGHSYSDYICKKVEEIFNQELFKK